jgi:hypothetical protein
MIQSVMDDIRDHPEYYKPLAMARRIRAIAIRFGITYDKAKEYVELSMQRIKHMKRQEGIDSFEPSRSLQEYRST